MGLRGADADTDLILIIIVILNSPVFKICCTAVHATAVYLHHLLCDFFPSGSHPNDLFLSIYLYLYFFAKLSSYLIILIIDAHVISLQMWPRVFYLKKKDV